VSTNEKIRSYFKNEFLIAFIFLFIFCFSLLFLSGSIDSGYHFEDDHEMININKILKSNNFFKTEMKQITEDYLNFKRFRFFYFFHRILEVKIFSDNFVLLRLYNSFLFFFSSFLLFCFMKKYGFSLIQALLFPLMTLLGEHTSVWWRLGPPESIAVFMLSLSLFFMIYGITTKKIIFDVLFVFCLILSSLSKESFVILIPAIIFWRVWIYKEINKENLIKSVIGNLFFILFFFIIVLIELGFILKIGINWNYAGIDGFRPLKYLNTFFTLSIVNGYGIIIILMFFFIFIYRFLFFKEKIDFRNLGFLIILFSLITIPQIVLHAKSRMFERFLLPAIFGYSFSIIYLFRFIIDIIKKNINLNFSNKKIVILFFLTLLFINFLINSYIIFKSANTSVPVTIKIDSDDNLSVDEIFFFRESPQRGLFEIERNDINRWQFEKFYLKNLVICFSNNFDKRKIKKLTLIIGEKPYTLTNDEFLRMLIPSNYTIFDHSYSVYKLASFYKKTPSIFPVLSIISNWGGDDLFIKKTIIATLFYLLIFGLLLIFYIIYVCLFIENYKINSLINIVTICLLTIFFSILFYQYKITFSQSKSFSDEGINTNIFLNNICKNTIKTSNILIVSDPAFFYEWSWSLWSYLKIQSERPNIFIYRIKTTINSGGFPKILQENVDNNEYKRIKNSINCISIFPRPFLEKEFLFESKEWFEPKDFHRIDNNGFVVYYK
jgi:hypothetical protein